MPNGAFTAPPHPLRADGAPRRAGFEIEFTGIGIEAAAAALTGPLGQDPQQITAAEYRFEHRAWGSFRLEVDWRYLKTQAQAARIGAGSPQWVEWLKRLAEGIVPLELVCPPLPLDRLWELNPLVTALRAAGGRGTSDSVIAALGVHINPELPALDVTTIERYLRSFALLQWWLVDAHGLDLSRRISPYVDLYPEAYALMLARQAGCDRLAAMIDAYLAHNPTRNRALDMLPLFLHLDEARIRAALDDERINPRPTFHYRLPDCHLEDPDWLLATSWRGWLTVERLASADEALDELSAAFTAAHRPLLGVSRRDWGAHVNRWLNERSLA